MSILIDIWLITVASIVSRIINSNIINTFKKEKNRINVINWTIILTQMIWTTYKILTVVFHEKVSNFFSTEVYELLIHSVCIYTPITLVMVMHLKNSLSVSRIMRMSKQTYNNWPNNNQELISPDDYSDQETI